jgi:hypothetical protein
MRTYKFLVYFTGTTPIEVNTGSFKSALIIATAQRIQAGLNTFATKVRNTETGERIMVKTSDPITINWVGSVLREETA